METFAHLPYNTSIQDYVSLIWELKGDDPSAEEILPCGVIEIIFNLSSPMQAVIGNRKIDKAPGCFIQGFHTKVVHVGYLAPQHLFGIRLKPHTVKSLLGVLPAETSNQAIDLTLIDKRFRFVHEQLMESNSFVQRVKVIESQFRPIDIKECHRTQLLSNLFLEDNLHLITPKKDQQSFAFDTVNTLAEQVCFSARHLNRKSKELFGLNAEELIRYKKFVNAIELIHRDRYSLSEVAHQSGFYDQSHFIRVFKSYASMTPKAYQKIKGGMPFHLFS